MNDSVLQFVGSHENGGLPDRLRHPIPYGESPSGEIMYAGYTFGVMKKPVAIIPLSPLCRWHMHDSSVCTLYCHYPLVAHCRNTSEVMEELSFGEAD